jgi:hypothetical protein
MRSSLKLLLILGIGLALRRGGNGPDPTPGDADGPGHTPGDGNGPDDLPSHSDTDGDGDATTYKGTRASGDLEEAFGHVETDATAGRAGDADGDGKPDLPGSKGDKGDGSWTSTEDANLSLTPEQNRAADEFLANSKANEPGITQNMQDMADSTGGEMVGLDYRLKDPESFKRKLATELAENGGDLDAALKDMKDSVRYTTNWDTGNYSDGVNNATQQLQDAGYESVKWKPNWDEGGGYKGVNSFWRDPSTGQVFEVQFHTPESFDAKMDTHGLYDEIRLLPEGDPRRAELEQQQDDIFSSVPIPPGSDEIRRPGG